MTAHQMPWSKRLFDICASLALMVILALPFGLLVLFLCYRQKGAVFYLSQRMTSPDRAFVLWKLRTMQHSLADAGVSGGDKSGRITPLGAFLRKYRLDEVPQLWNVLKGEMSFVGPRPPLRLYVERFPDLYAEVLKCRPGITGMASLYFHRHEEKLLSVCLIPADTDKVYARRCIPRKAQLDLIYRESWSFCLDLQLLIQTLRRVMIRRSSK